MFNFSNNLIPSYFHSFAFKVVQEKREREREREIEREREREIKESDWVSRVLYIGMSRRYLYTLKIIITFLLISSLTRTIM